MSLVSKEASTHFKFDAGNQIYVCQVIKGEGICGSEIKKKNSDGGYVYNSKRHLMNAHEEIGERIKELDKLEKGKKVAPGSKRSHGQSSITDKLKTVIKRATTSITEEELRLSILQNVAYDGVALSYFVGKGFQTLNREVARKLDVPLGRHSMKKMVIDRCEVEVENV